MITKKKNINKKKKYHFILDNSIVGGVNLIEKKPRNNMYVHLKKIIK